ncbi:hypothetical protein HYY75_10330 [bacterium]|nr:hypothetical protein [bacterium]
MSYRRVSIFFLMVFCFFPFSAGATDFSKTVVVPSQVDALIAKLIEVQNLKLSLSYLIDPRAEGFLTEVLKNLPSDSKENIRAKLNSKFAHLKVWSLDTQIEEISSKIVKLVEKNSANLSKVLEASENSSFPESAVFSPLLKTLLDQDTFNSNLDSISSPEKNEVQKLVSRLKGENEKDLFEALEGKFSKTQVKDFPIQKLLNLSPNVNFSEKEPVVGAIHGFANGARVHLILDKLAGKVRGEVNGNLVSLRSFPFGTISGEANGAQVDLREDWSPETYVVDGTANNSPVRVSIDWKKGTLTGYSNHSSLAINFDMEKGTVVGYANHGQVSLQYKNGSLTGYMNHSQVDLHFLIYDLHDFLQNFYLFLN